MDTGSKKKKALTSNDLEYLKKFNAFQRGEKMSDNDRKYYGKQVYDEKVRKGKVKKSPKGMPDPFKKDGVRTGSESLFSGKKDINKPETDLGGWAEYMSSPTKVTNPIKKAADKDAQIKRDRDNKNRAGGRTIGRR